MLRGKTARGKKRPPFYSNSVLHESSICFRGALEEGECGAAQSERGNMV